MGKIFLVTLVSIISLIEENRLHMKSIKLLVVVAILCGSQLLMAADAITPSWCGSIVAKGKLVQTKAKDMYKKQFTVSVLNLEKPLTIPAGECNGLDLPKLSNVKEIQIKETDNVMAKYVGKTILVSGDLSGPEAPSDVKDVTMYPPVEIQVVQ